MGKISFMAIAALVIASAGSYTGDAASCGSEFHCDIPDCMETEEHTHMVCDDAYCTETAPHVHNGECYYGHSAGDGHAYHSCGVDGCTIAETHRHESSGHCHHSGGRHHH